MSDTLAAATIGADADDERMRRWRLVLGGDDDGTGCKLNGLDLEMDKALAALYNKGGYETGGGGTIAARGRGRGGQQTPRSAGLGASSPQVARWLGDIRSYFPQTVVQIMQREIGRAHV